MDSARLGDMVVLTAEQLAVATEDERDEYERYVLWKVVEADEWDLWVQAMWADYVPHGFAPHHEEFWRWVWSIEKGVRPRPFVGIWPRGHGKRVDDATPVWTERGWVAHGSLRVGDRVFHPDGNPTAVVAVHEPSERPLFRVTFTDGCFVDADPEHEWTVWDHSMSRWVTLETQRIAALKYRSAGRSRFLLPHRDALQQPAQQYVVSPYLMGYWLGDGNKSTGVLACGSAGDADEVACLIEGFGDVIKNRRVQQSTGCHYLTVEGLRRRLSGAGWLGSARVPEAYLRGSVGQRRHLLAGLVDSDGHVDRVRGRVRFVSHRRELAEDVCTVARSLGYAARVWSEVDSRDPHPVTDLNGATTMVTTAGVRWVAAWTPHDGAGQGLLSRKQVPVWARRERVGFQSIEPVASVLGRCITVDRSDGLYLVGEGMVPTHNSTTVEMAVTALAARGVRAYCLYVSEKQDQADDHVQNIAALLESPALGKAFPSMGRPLLNKMGQSKGWRRNRVRTESGFTVDAIGFDTAARGVKLENQRPDIIVLDDIDGEHDTLATARKKVQTLTTKFIPSGSSDVAYIAIQNLIIDHGVFGRLCGRFEPTDPEDMELGKFLRDKIVCGPVPAVEGLVVEDRPERYVITEGVPTWPEGKPLEVCEAEINDMGLTSFNAECQHKAQAPGGGMFDHLDWGRFREGEGEVPHLMRTVCWLDPAVTSTNRSDNCGVCITGIDRELRLHVLWAWEGISGPMAVLKNATRHAVQFGCDTFGVESNQGGDTWEILWRQALTELEDEQPGWLQGRRLPRFRDEKASEATGGKVARARQMLATYEQHNRIKHVEGTTHVLEAALHRFPRVKPYDLVDAAWWAWWDLTSSPGGSTRRAAVRSSARDTVSSAWG